MAEKRMFTQKIIDSDQFLEMPLSAQALYFHLNMRADDDGFVNNPKRIARYINASEDDLRLLVIRRFIIAFDTGVIVIKHWRMHNTLKADRYHPTDYQEEFAMLDIKENKSYTEHTEQIQIVEPTCIQNVSIVEPQKRTDKDIGLGLDKKREDKEYVSGTVYVKSRYSDDFEKFWQAYPRKHDKGNAYKKYSARINSGYTSEQLIEAATNYAKECKRNHTERMYIKHPATFLSDATPFIDYLKKSDTSQNNDEFDTNVNPLAEYLL